MTLLGFVPAVLLSMMVTIQGEVVFLRTRQPDVDAQSQCILPSILNVKIERERGQVEVPEMTLLRREVVSTERHVHVMKRDTDGVVRLVHHSVHETKVLAIQAYHNHKIGASFVVSCVLSDLGRMYFRLEGSIYFDTLKYRLAPEILHKEEEDDSIYFESEHTTVTYSMIQVEESFYCGTAAVQNKGISTQTNNFVNVSQPDKGSETENSDINSQSGDDQSAPKPHRYRRSTEVYYVDVLPIVDYSTFSLWFDRYQDEDRVKALLNIYLANTLTAVDMRLQTLQLNGVELRAKMVNPIISTVPEASNFSENIKVKVDDEFRVSAPILLGNFAEWVDSQTDLPPHDHAMLFISYDLTPTEDPRGDLTNITKGLANVAALCKNGSVSLIEDKGAYQSENIAAHELGHGLGSYHDGEDNTCRPADRYMMSPLTYPQRQSNLLHPWQFSTCSSTAISTYIQSLELVTSVRETCLLGQDGQDVNSSLSLTAQSACEMIYGNTSFPCRNVENFSEICTQLRCRTIQNPNCILVVPPTGTCCGTAKNCVGGICVDGAEGTCPTDDECPFGDQPILQIGNNPETTCGEMNSAYCYLDAIRNVCCGTCRKYWTGDASCLYGDRVIGCSAVTDVSQCRSPSLSNDCCGTCRRLSTDTPTTRATATVEPVPTTRATKPPTLETSPETTVTAATATAAATVTQTSASAEVPTTTTKTTEKPSENNYGFKPNGFVGCYLPPCAATRMFNPAMFYALVIVCLVTGRNAIMP